MTEKPDCSDSYDRKAETAEERAREYFERGWNPIPIDYREKKPRGEEWQKNKITAATLPKYFNGQPMNVGIQLGPMSRGLTDVDLDSPEAVALGPYLLPGTRSIFGRASKRRSHWLYKTDLADTVDRAEIHFNDPITKKRIVELRIGGGAKGAQTVAPGSTHKDTGEVITWDQDGTPAEANGAKLRRQVEALAAAAALVPHWPRGEGTGRHDAALILGGFLARAGWAENEILQFVGALAQVTGDEELEDRQKAASDALKAFKGQQKTYGFPELAKLVSEPVAKAAADWIGFKGSRAPDPIEEPQAAHEPLPFIDVMAWEDVEPPPRDWLVQGRIPMETVSLVSGEGGIGKSVLLLQLLVATVLGRPWLNSLIEPSGPVVAMCCEDDADELHRRLYDICRFYEASFGQLAERGFYLLSYAGRDAILAAPDKGAIVRPTPLFHRFKRTLEEIRPRAFLIDTVADVFAGNENDRTHVRQFVTMMRGLAKDNGSAGIMTLHPSLTGISTGTGISGSTAWNNSVRAREYLTVPKGDDGMPIDKNVRELTQHKNNYGPMAEPLLIRLKNGAFVLNRDERTAFERAYSDQKADELFMRLVDEFKGNLSNMNGINYAPKLLAEDPEVKRAGLHLRDLEAAMKRVMEAGKVYRKEYGRGSQPHWKLALRKE